MQAGRALLRFAPGLAALARYERRWLARDLLAGVSVAAVAVPVGIAYADLAGAPPIVGIYSAIFPLLAYALFGSSRQLIIGPDAATCILVAATVASHAHGDAQRYAALLPALTLLTGVLYVAASAGRLGFIADFLSQPILIGYLNGIALIVAVGQLSKLLGYPSGSREFVAQLQELAAHWGTGLTATAWLGLSIVAGLLLLKRLAPALPAPLIGVVAGIVAVVALDLQSRGIAVTGTLPSGLPQPRLPSAGPGDYRALLHDAAALMVVSFASGMLTAKSFAERNRYRVDANQELAAFGIANVVSGLVQGFAVTGADSRTAVNNAAGGQTQLVGIVAALVMLGVLLFLRGPLALVPTAALAAVVLVSALGMLDAVGLARLARMSWREGLLSVGTTLGVLVLGVIPGVGLAIALSLAWLLMMASRPNTAVLGRVPDVEGFHSTADHPQGRTEPGLLLFRFEGSLLFFNTAYFRARLAEAVAAAPTPVSWVVLDASPINWVDATALQSLAELQQELAARGVTLGFAGVRRSLRRAFNASWVQQWRRECGIRDFATLGEAVHAFEREARATG
jgi:high affinity sulfate transporter 1